MFHYIVLVVRKRVIVPVANDRFILIITAPSLLEFPFIVVYYSFI